MTQARKDALKELRAKVEAGGYDTPNFIALVSKPHQQCRAGEAYRGSLDAALDLHNGVLPGMPVKLTDMSADFLGGHGWDVTINYPFNRWDDSYTTHWTNHSFTAYSKAPARAWLIAILKALIAECDE